MKLAGELYMCDQVLLNWNSFSDKFRVKDEIVNVKIHGKGKKFDLGGGNQFDSIEDLIGYYKKYPFSVSDGTIVRLHQVFV